MAKRTKESEQQPAQAFSIELVEADSLDGPWAPVPADAYTFVQRDLDTARLDNPSLNEIVPIDHRTVLGTLGGIPQMLGFELLKVVREHLGEHCYLRDVRNWLRKRNIDGRDINWTDFCALLREREKTPGEGPILTRVVIERYEVSARTLRRHIAEGKLHSRRESKKGQHSFNEAELDRLYTRRS